MSITPRKHPAHIRYLVEEIVKTCRDAESSRFYSKVAQVLPDERIFQFLSEIRQDPSIRRRGAVFTAKSSATWPRTSAHARQDDFRSSLSCAPRVSFYTLFYICS
jgi:hypothetical protein